VTKKYQTTHGTTALAVPMRGDGGDHRGPAGPGRGRRAAGDAGVDGGRRDGGVRAARQARSGPVRDPAWQRSGIGEVPVPAYDLFSSTELLGKIAMERMLAGVSTRRYPAALEPVGAAVDAEAASVSKSAVSRKFVAMTEHALADLLAADLSGLDLVAINIDGVHFADHLCVVALGIGIDGTKHPSPRYKDRRRTPPWSGGCWSGCANAAPAMPASTYRDRHTFTIGRDAPTRSAISALRSPSEANNTIQAHCASPARTDDARTSRLSSS
jgi:hypothetical protein